MEGSQIEAVFRYWGNPSLLLSHEVLYQVDQLLPVEVGQRYSG